MMLLRINRLPLIKNIINKGSISNIRFKSSISNEASSITAVNDDPDYLKRFKVTAEVTISKIFPAGFGWQCGSLIAANYSIPATDISFALLTGLGDMTGKIN